MVAYRALDNQHKRAGVPFLQVGEGQHGALQGHTYTPILSLSQDTLPGEHSATAHETIGL